MCRHIYDRNIVNCDVKQPIYLTLPSSTQRLRPRDDAGGLSREYVLRITSVSFKATKGAPLYSHSR